LVCIHAWFKVIKPVKWIITCIRMGLVIGKFYPDTSIVVIIFILPTNLLSPGGPFTKIFMSCVCILPNRYIFE
jgi:hypothetical protein